MRLKLSKIEKPSVEQSSIQGFISPTLTRSESGDMIYSPSLKYRWAVTYIRLQKTEQYKYQDSKYVVEISTVGEHQIKEQDCRHVIRYQDLKLHQEISVRKTKLMHRLLHWGYLGYPVILTIIPDTQFHACVVPFNNAPPPPNATHLLNVLNLML